MEFIFVSYPESRTVRSGGNAVGPTDQTLMINGGMHTITLSDPQDYLPASQRVAVSHTSVATPLRLSFTPIARIFEDKFSRLVFDAARECQTVDAFVAALVSLQLDWHLEKEGSFGRRRATARLENNEATGESWIIAALEDAAWPSRQPNPGGPYGELLFTLAGALDDAGATSRIRFYGSELIPLARATGFWVGLAHQPRGAKMF